MEVTWAEAGLPGGKGGVECRRLRFLPHFGRACAFSLIPELCLGVWTFGGRARWPGDRILAGLFDDFREGLAVEFFHDFRIPHELFAFGGNLFPFFFQALDKLGVLFAGAPSSGVDFDGFQH